MKKYNRIFETENYIKNLIISITKGSRLIDKRLSSKEYTLLRKWAKTQPIPKGYIYRVVRVEMPEFYDKHIYDAHQQNSLQKDEPIKIKEFESWTFNRDRVYSYGNAKKYSQEAVLFILDASKIECVDLSTYSVYPEEREVRNLNKEVCRIKKATYGKVGWELLLDPL